MSCAHTCIPTPMSTEAASSARACFVARIGGTESLVVEIGCAIGRGVNAKIALRNGKCNLVQRSPLLTELGERCVERGPQDGDEALERVVQLLDQKDCGRERQSAQKKHGDCNGVAGGEQAEAGEHGGKPEHKHD